ncbi:MAG: hypothetical protein JXA73_26370 [Acidobacteria bacterium]|nr:hypothetical protein [Acidobacteriota bacterium]
MAKSSLYVLACLILAGLFLRIWNFPSRYELRDVDELGYTYGGMLLWEGLSPGFKMSPAGVQTWISWLYCAGKSSINLIRDWGKDSLPAAVRPFYAVDQALFETYRDTSTLRQFTVGIIVLISLAGVWAAYQMGFRRAGISGGLLSGGLTAMLPIFVQASGMAKPYMPAWSFGIIAHYFAALPATPARLTAGAIFMGLAASSRIEMLLFFPIILWEVWNENRSGKFIRLSLRFILISTASILLVSPWLLTNLLGNIRTIATVRLSAASTQDYLGPMMKDFAWLEGLSLVALLIVIGLAISPRDKRCFHWVLLGIFLILFLTMLKPTPYGLRHHGATVVAGIVLSPLALSGIQRFYTKTAIILSVALLILPALHSVTTAASDRSAYTPDRATEWVEQHVPPGTTVYLSPTLHDPLPTRRSSDALWADVTSGQAWERKFQQSLSRFNIPGSRTPRSLSEENMIQERGNRRRWFILGAGPQNELPRFDIKIISGGSPFDLTPDEAISRFVENGGAFILRQLRQPEFQRPPDILGVPKATWTGLRGQSVSVYLKPHEYH